MSVSLYENQPGQVRIDKLTITSHAGKVDDISKLFHTIDIIEEIDNFVTVGEMTIPDTVGLAEFLPIIGGEKISINFRTNKDFSPYIKDFIVTKMGEETSLGTGKTTKLLRIYFSSDKNLFNVQGQYSKSYNTELVSDIFTDIFSNQLGGGSVEVDGTSNFINFVIPYWNPFTTIHYLMQKAESATYLDSAYLFYESKIQHHFVPISHLFAKPSMPNKNIILHQAIVGDYKSGSKHNANYIGNALSFDFTKRFDIIDDIKNGVTGATVYTFDYTLKHFMKRGINWHGYYDTHAWNNGMRTIHPETYINKEATVHEFTDFITDKIVTGVDYPYIIFNMARTFLRNKNRYNQLKNYVLVVNKSGDSDLTCGKMLLVKYLSRDETRVLNDKLYGNYLIKGIKHKISTSFGYAQTVELIKDAFWSDRHGITKKIGARINPGKKTDINRK